MSILYLNLKYTHLTPSDFLNSNTAYFIVQVLLLFLTILSPLSVFGNSFAKFFFIQTSEDSDLCLLVI